MRSHVSARTVIRSKIGSVTFLQAIPVVFLAAVGALSGNISGLPTALLLCIPVSDYTLAITIYMTGLSPAILLYDVKVLVSSLVFIGMPSLFIGGAVFISPAAGIAIFLLLIPTWFIGKGEFPGGILASRRRSEPEQEDRDRHAHVLRL